MVIAMSELKKLQEQSSIQKNVNKIEIINIYKTYAVFIILHFLW